MNEIKESKKDKVNISFFNSCSFWGGGEKFYLDFANYLKSTGKKYKISFVLNKQSQLYQRVKNVEEYTVLQINFKKHSYLNFFKLFKFLKFVKTENPAVIFAENFPDLRFIAIALFFTKKPPKIIYSIGVPTKLKNRWYKKFIFKKVAIIHTASETIKNKLLSSSGFDFDNEKIKVIYPAIKVSQASTPQFEPEHKRAVFTIGHASRLAIDKAQHFLLDAAKILKEKGIDFKLLIAGTGPLENELKQKALELGLNDNVHFLGFQSNMSDFYKKIDVFAFTSYEEGFGYVLIEAMSYKIPVVAFAKGSPTEIIRNGLDGFLIEPYNVSKFAEALLKFYNTPELIQKFGENARQRVEKIFNIEKSYGELEKLIYDNK